MKKIIVKLAERYFPKYAKKRRFRIIGECALAHLKKNPVIEPELLLLPFLLQNEHGACIDAGAYVGEYCFVLEKMVPKEMIYAFEPNARSRGLLKKFFPDIRVYEEALSDCCGEANLKIPQMRNKKYETRGTMESFSEPGETGRSYLSIKKATLDSIVERDDVSPIAFIKIDVEGHERKVIKGGKNSIQKNRPIILVEIEQRHLKEPIGEVFEEIRRLGYRGFFLDLPDFKLREISDFSASRHQKVDDLKGAFYVRNFFFFPDEKSGELLLRLKNGIKSLS